MIFNEKREKVDDENNVKWSIVMSPFWIDSSSEFWEVPQVWTQYGTVDIIKWISLWYVMEHNWRNVHSDWLIDHHQLIILIIQWHTTPSHGDVPQWQVHCVKYTQNAIEKVKCFSDMYQIDEKNSLRTERDLNEKHVFFLGSFFFAEHYIAAGFRYETLSATTSSRGRSFIFKLLICFIQRTLKDQ